MNPWPRSVVKFSAMVTVEQADIIIQQTAVSFGAEQISFDNAVGRVLAADLVADRDLPPYDRVMMDGIAISHSAIGNKGFIIEAVQAAGDNPVALRSPEACIEIMTGAVLPPGTDTVIRYEDLRIENGTAFLLTDAIKKGQHIHYRGQDRRSQETVIKTGAVINAAVISMAASVGAATMLVSKLPRVLIISSGDEIVDVSDTPLPFQIRRSNSYAVGAALKRYHIEVEYQHLPDDMEQTEMALRNAISRYDVIVLSGGISMGKFDHIPAALETLGVEKLFHKVQQKPGKPFWFGKHAGGTTIFAFPGNPVATFLCLHRYLIPWLEKALNMPDRLPVFARLAEALSFAPALQYFVPVSLFTTASGELMAGKVDNNNSGDFSGLVDANAFIELPMDESVFAKGSVHRVWLFNAIS